MENYNIYLNTENEKYSFFEIAKKIGAQITGVSGCGNGYYIQLNATPCQAEQINDLLGAVS